MAKAKINPAFTYKTRDGQEVTDVEFVDVVGNDPYKVCATVEGYAEFFTERGYYYKGQINTLDLIKQPVKKPKTVVKEAQKEVVKNASTSEVVQQDVPSTQHIHHDMIVAWAKNPSKQVQSKTASGLSWYDTEFPEWRKSQEYRFKPEEPKFLTIIGADGKARSYPEPCSKPPENGAEYFVAYPTSVGKEMSSRWEWCGDNIDSGFLNKNIIHLTKEAAELHAKAMLGID